VTLKSILSKWKVWVLVPVQPTALGLVSLQNCERVSFCSKPPDLRLYFRKLHLGAEDFTYHWSDTVILLVTHEGNIILASLLSFLQTLSSFSDSDSTPPALCGHSMAQRWFPEQHLSLEVRGSELSGRRARAPPPPFTEHPNALRLQTWTSCLASTASTLEKLAQPRGWGWGATPWNWGAGLASCPCL
jgi:hypothetical protein